MRNWLTVAAVVVFAASTGLLEVVKSAGMPPTDLPRTMAVFDPTAYTAPAAADGMVTSGIAR